jgi:hypothetical protein
MNGGGTIDSSVTLDEVFTVLGAKRVPLAPELAGYLVLEVAEHADPSGGDVDPKSVFVGEEGTVALVKPKRNASAGQAEASVRIMLARLLDVSGSQTPALAAVSKRKSGAGLPALAQELETALVPVNRAAGRRALARLAREVRRVTLGVGRNALPSSSDVAAPSRRTSPLSGPSTAAEALPRASRSTGFDFSPDEEATTTRRSVPNELFTHPTPRDLADLPVGPVESPASPHGQASPEDKPSSQSQADVDSLIEQFSAPPAGDPPHAGALKAMAGLEPTPPPPSRSPVPRESDDELGDIESLLTAGADTDHPGPEERQLPTQPSRLRRGHLSSPSAVSVNPDRSPGIWPLLALCAVGIGLIAGFAAVWTLRTASPSRASQERAPSTEPPAPALATAACRATLVVSNVPSRAEVLLRQGQAPIDVEKMPVGARLEFVATADGYAPKRVVVPAGAAWDSGLDGKPRFEAGVQLEKSSRGLADPWPAGEPGSEVGGQGAPGTVHVVATPRGAEIWMLAGMGPDARIEQLRCDREFDVLVAGPTTLRKRLHVSPGDFRSEGPSGPHVARVAVP